MPESSERGALTEAVFYILLSVYESRHGYGIMQYIEKISDSRVILGAGTLYGAINTLLSKKWIKLEKSSLRKKEYVITNLGKKIVNYEIIRLKELIINGEVVIKEGKND